MPHTKDDREPEVNGGSDGFDLGALTDKYSVSSDIDLSGVESLFRELSVEKKPNADNKSAKTGALADSDDTGDIDDIVNEFEKTMPKNGGRSHSPRVVYAEDGGFNNEPKPVTLKKRDIAVNKNDYSPKTESRPAAGIPVGKKKSAGSRVIFSADPTDSKDGKPEVKAEDNTYSKAVPVSKKRTEIKDEENKDDFVPVTAAGSDSEEFADILKDISDDKKTENDEAVKESEAVNNSDEKPNEDKAEPKNENTPDESDDEFFDVKIESLDPSASNAFTEDDMLLYEKERNKALGKKDSKGAFKRFVRSVIPQKGDSAGETVRKIILIVSAVTILVCAVWFGNYYLQHFNEKDELKKLGTEVTTDPDADLAAEWAKIKAEFPDVDFPDGMNIKYARAYAVNRDMVGKLKIPGTAIDIPIVQCKDDTADYQYYLKHSFQKKDSKYGTPFMSAECDPFNLGDTTVIHGHNMYDNLMFADLEKYYKLDGYKESPTIQYNTLFKDYDWKIFAIIITNGSASGDNGYVFDFTAPSFGSKQNKADFIDGLLERSIYNIDVDVNADDKLLVLNTCCYVFNGAHLGVAARMVRPGESADVDVSKATVNENARYPQAWYDAKNQSNPYKDAYRWHQTG